MEDFNLETPLEILKRIANLKTKPSKWDSSSFGFIKSLPTSNIGEVGEEFIFEMCVKLIDKETERNPHARDEYDVKILKKKVEVKTATEDTSGSFQFNGIRYHRKYDYLLVLGISPENIYFNFYTGSDVKSQKIGNLVSMEKGAVGSQKLTRKKSQLHDISRFKEILNKELK